MKKYLFLSLLLTILFACNTEEHSPEAHASFAMNVVESNKQFDDYWYQGKAEITSYDLEQARYGELHQGHAVMVFVTEDFSKGKKVKLDNPSKTPKDAVPVLKVNATRKFNTGVYPYSMMTSVFTPIKYKQYPNALKVSSTSQEWCGHSYMQLKAEKNHFDFELRSYFESEGESNRKVEKEFLEDDLWNRIRINPQSLPKGKVKMLPSTMFARLRHIEYKAYPANASLNDHISDSKLLSYQLDYSGINRKLTIHFSKKFPYEIEGWEETMTSGFGPNAKSLLTKATKKKAILSDYWSRHGNVDLKLRDELGLPR